MNYHESQIITLLENIKQFYIERNPDNIRKLENLLFDVSSSPIIIGASNDEWRFGIPEANELFLSDWDGWGNVSIDMSSLKFKCFDSIAWFHIKAGVEYCFKDNDVTYTNYMNRVQKIAKGTKSPLSKTGEIIWLLSHLLHQRKLGERKYIWDMNITGILKSINGIYKVKVMQFSIPVQAKFSDVRINTNEDDTLSFKLECNKINAYNHKFLSRNDMLKNQLALLFDNCNQIEWNTDGTKSFIGADGICRDGREFIGYIMNFKQNGILAQFSPDNIIAEQNGEFFYFCGVGVFSREISLNSELNNVLDNIEYYNNMKDKRDALYKIRRDLSLALKEASLPNNCINPFRIEGIGRITSKQKIYLEYVQISYPFNWILEQKTDAEIEL